MADPPTVSVDLPDGMLEEMRTRMRSLQFADPRFYVRWLIAKDVRPKSDDARLDVALCLEGMESGDAMDYDTFVKEVTERTDRMLQEKGVAREERVAG